MPRKKPSLTELAQERFRALGIPESLHSQLLQGGKVIQLKRGEIYSLTGDKHLPLTIILQGKLFGYQLDKEGERKTSMVFSTTLKGVILDPPNLIRQHPTGLDIEALTNCTLLAIPASVLEEIRRESFEFMTWYITLIESFAVRATYFIRALQHPTAKESALTLYRYFPDFFKELPMKHLAEMLGMNRNTLTRLLQEADPDFQEAPEDSFL